MTKEVSILIVRAAALFLLLNALSGFSYILNVLSYGPDYSEGISLVTLWGRVLIPAFLSIFMFWKSRLIGLIMSGAPSDDIKVNEEGLVRAGTFLFGVWLLINTVGEATGYISTIRLQQNIGVDSTSRNVGSDTALMVSFLVSLFLILGNRLVSKFYRKLAGV